MVMIMMPDSMDLNIEIDRRSGLAVWAQIAEQIRTAIVAGTLQPGQRLPTEQGLAASLSVNRHTVRRGLSVLAEQGLVRIEQGRGSYVEDHILDYALGSRTRFSENLAGQAERVERKLIDVRDTAASTAQGKALAIRRGTHLWQLVILGSVDGRPISIADHLFPKARFPDMPARFKDMGSITRTLASYGVHDFTRLRTRITATMPSIADAERLEIPRTRPILRTEGVNVDGAQVPIELGIARMASDRVQLIVDGTDGQM